MKIDIDHDRFNAAGFHVKEHGPDASFHALDGEGGHSEHYFCRVAMDDGALLFFPTRSASQRLVLRALGHHAPEPTFP